MAVMDSSVSLSYHFVAFWLTYMAIICLANKRGPDTDTKRDGIYNLFISPTFSLDACLHTFKVKFDSVLEKQIDSKRISLGRRIFLFAA